MYGIRLHSLLQSKCLVLSCAGLPIFDSWVDRGTCAGTRRKRLLVRRIPTRRQVSGIKAYSSSIDISIIIILSHGIVNCVTHNRCRKQFDFSDHIVLFISHYFVPCSLEIAAILVKIQCKLPYGFTQPVGLVAYSVPLLASFIIVGFNIKSTLDTSTYFHTFAENLFALFLTILLVGLPLHFFADTRYWCACIFGATLSTHPITKTESELRRET